MTFLGVDIGYDRCGVCVLEYEISRKNPDIVFAGSIITDKGLAFSDRLKILFEDLSFIKNKYSPEFMSIERLFFHRKNVTFEKICMSKGVALMLFNDIKTLEVEPKKVKKSIVGDGNATKSEIKSILEKILNLDLANVLDDTLDALCLALYHIDQIKLESMVSKSNTQVLSKAI